MNNLEPINQTKLYGLNKYFDELTRFYKKDIYPNKILFSGQKGIGKSTLAFHLINYILTSFIIQSSSHIFIYSNP